MKKPTFVIKFGPPASGKSTVISKCMSFHVNRVIGINDYIEKDPGFKRNSMRLARQTPMFANKLSRGNANLAKRGKEVYMTYRQRYSRQHNKDMRDAIQLRQNISFETTGISGFPDWLWDVFPELNEYQVIVLFPVLPASVAYKRYIQRAKKMVNEGIGFRFGSTYKQFIDMYIKIYVRFLEEHQAFLARRSNVSMFIVYDTPDKSVRCKRPDRKGLERVMIELQNAMQLQVDNKIRV
jgi:hypothetical protein